MSHLLRKLRLLDFSLNYKSALSDDEIDFAFQCLEESEDKVFFAAFYLISDHSKEVVDRLLECFHTFPLARQHFICSGLMSCSFRAPYDFFLERLKTCDDALAHFIIICLSKSTYFLFPLILSKMNAETTPYQTRLQKLLKKIGFKKLKLPLSVFPDIPHERTFRNLFGDAAINAIQSSNFNT